jgi:hypothetical protein
MSCPHETNAFDSLSDSYTGKGRFNRDPNKLIPHKKKEQP